MLFGHAMGTRNTPPVSSLPRWLSFADVGVQVFFVLSGFLITRLLLIERAEHGTISLGQFYLRRAFRIVPANLAYVAAVVVLSTIGWLALRDGDLWHALTYTVNYHPTSQRSWYLGHLWSLSIEEQFYLLWPALVLVLTWRGAVGTAIGAALMAPLLRFALLLVPHHAEHLGEAFPLTCDSLAVGCLLAHLQPRLDASPRYLQFLHSRAFLAVPAIMVATMFVPGAGFREVIMPTIHDLGIALLIERFTRAPASLPSRVLQSRPLVLLGTISYSLYLWQQPFLDRSSDGWWAAFPLNIALALATAAVSYFVIEKPFLALGRRLLTAARPPP